jgi:uncharacterized membrane protein
MEPIVWEWVNFVLRWLHVVTAIAWIGSSFYFIHLDLSLNRRPGLPEGTAGEAWQVHGGGFYHMVKFTSVPPDLPEKLTWFKWEAYSTFLSGFFLLCVLYYRGADLFLIDSSVFPLSHWGAIAISAGSLALGWIVYDLMCRSALGRDDTRLAAAGFVLLVAASWGFAQIFSGRAAMLQTGALIGTMMVANVFFVIIPNQRRVIDTLIAGGTPDPDLGRRAKQRSLHNNYLTLPVIFLMLSNHYPLSFGTHLNWVIAAVVLVVGAVIRHFFNARHAGRPSPWWTWAVAAAGMLAIVWISAQPPADEAEDTSGQAAIEAVTPAGVILAQAPGAPAAPSSSVDFAEVEEIVISRCSMCHAEMPVWDGIVVAPRGVRLDTAEEIRRHAGQILLHAVLSRSMPPGNITEISPEERRLLGQWASAETR